MNNLSEQIKSYIEKNKLTIEDFAKSTDISVDTINKIIDNEYTPKDEELSIIEDKLKEVTLSKGKKIVKAIELILKFGACIMALVTLLLCIMGNVEPQILISLLSVGVVCATIPSLPKIDK